MTAVASYLDAKAAGGEWLVRIEDVDRPRSVEGADALILRTLEAYGFRWDGEVLWQSRRDAVYRAALDRLRSAGHVYPCGCSRKESGTGVYPGTCRNGLPQGKQPRAWRLRVPEEEVGFDDRIQGPFAQNLAHDAGDFVLLRADGLFAYQLAVVVDDAEQGITDVVRGFDMLDSTPRQIYLQRLLDYPTPRYAHVPLALDAQGVKLSKQNGAAPLVVDDAVPSLAGALAFLGHAAPAEAASLDELWSWAMAHWSVRAIPKIEKR